MPLSQLVLIISTLFIIQPFADSRLDPGRKCRKERMKVIDEWKPKIKAASKEIKKLQNENTKKSQEVTSALRAQLKELHTAYTKKVNEYLASDVTTMDSAHSSVENAYRYVLKKYENDWEKFGKTNFHMKKEVFDNVLKADSEYIEKISVIQKKIHEEVKKAGIKKVQIFYDTMKKYNFNQIPEPDKNCYKYKDQYVRYVQFTLKPVHIVDLKFKFLKVEEKISNKSYDVLYENHNQSRKHLDQYITFATNSSSEEELNKKYQSYLQTIKKKKEERQKKLREYLDQLNKKYSKQVLEIAKNLLKAKDIEWNNRYDRWAAIVRLYQ